MKKHILIVEDDADLCNAMMKMLFDAEYEPHGSLTIKDAQLKLQNQAYGCIILDMRLGESTGEELIEFIRGGQGSLNNRTPILVVSGYLDKALVQKIAGKIQGALVKPFDTQTLLSNVKKLVAV
jgi:DNA-binding NtrC family response regulator